MKGQVNVTMGTDGVGRKCKPTECVYPFLLLAGQVIMHDYSCVDWWRGFISSTNEGIRHRALAPSTAVSYLPGAWHVMVKRRFSLVYGCERYSLVFLLLTKLHTTSTITWTLGDALRLERSALMPEN